MWLWGRFLLFGLGSATTACLKVIIDITVSRRVTIDWASCLNEETDASVDGGRMASKKQWRRDGQSVQMYGRSVWCRCIQDGTEIIIVRSTPIGR
ncbi:hypothetical protein TNCV_3865621 [Trichonephila clavipes]|nr:hypothetical protein TNCV_3865621 [Trichonephila clavipes]